MSSDKFLKLLESHIVGFLYLPQGTLNFPSLLTLYNPLKQVLFKKINSEARFTSNLSFSL